MEPDGNFCKTGQIEMIIGILAAIAIITALRFLGVDAIITQTITHAISGYTCTCGI